MNEGAGSTEFTVTATYDGVPLTTEVTIDLALGGTADSPDDYTGPTSASVTIPANAASGTATLNLNVKDDDDIEGDETIIVGGSSGSLVISSAVITIHDDEATYLSIAGPSGEVSEGSNATFTVTLSKAVGAAVTVTWAASEGTAGTSDYGTAPGSVTFPANSAAGATQTITIPVTDDSLSEGEETFSVALATDTGDQADIVFVKTMAASATATIAASDPITVNLSGSSNVDEGDTATYTISISGGVPSENLTVSYDTADDGAEAGSDYTAASGTLNFTQTVNGDQTVDVPTTDDIFSEGSEDFTFAITSHSGGGGTVTLNTNSVTTTVNASDPITVSITGPTSVDEGDTTTAYTVSLSPSGVKPTADLTVSYATSNGTATAGADYTAKSGTLTFTETEAEAQTFTVQTTEDNIDEGTGEDFTVTLSSVTGGGGPTPSLGTSKSVTTTIADDDDASDVTLSVSPSSLGEDDEATSVTVTATMNGGTLPSDTVVTIGTLSGSATKDTDYTATSLDSITIPANTASGTGTITITPTDDSVVEGTETITIPGSTTVNLDVSDAEITLEDKSASPGENVDGAELSIAGPASSVSEGGNAVFTVTLSHQVAAEVSVTWSAPLDTDSADESDLEPNSGIVTFAANSVAGATQTITITATNDSLPEGDETFTVTLETVTSTLGDQVSVDSSASSATATISASDAPRSPNPDPPPPPTPPPPTPTPGPSGITIAVSPTSISEDAGATEVTVTAGFNASGTRRVDTVVMLTLAGDADDTDYTATSLPRIRIPAGRSSRSGTFTITPKEDDTIEGSESIRVVGASSGLTSGSATITLTNSTSSDEPGPHLSISANSGEVREGEDAEFTVTLLQAVDFNVVVTYSIIPGTASPTDYVHPSTPIFFDADSDAGSTRTLSVPVRQDLLSEGRETFTVILGTSSRARIDQDMGSATATILASDPITVELSGPVSLREGEAGTYTVSLSPAGVIPTANLTVAYATSDGSARAGSDYTSASGRFTFSRMAAGPQTFRVSTNSDAGGRGHGGDLQREHFRALRWRGTCAQFGQVFVDYHYQGRHPQPGG